MSKHTPEPWEIDAGLSITSAEELPTPSDGPMKHNVIDMPLNDQGRANAQRIVECVNAFEGVKNPEFAMAIICATLGFAKMTGHSELAKMATQALAALGVK